MKNWRWGVTPPSQVRPRNRHDAAAHSSASQSLGFDGLPNRSIPAWRVRLIKLFRKCLSRTLGVFHVRQGLMVNGFWYKELSPIPLAKALQRHAGDSSNPAARVPFKEYRVTFPDGAKQIIRCSADDVYADLMGSVGLEHYYKLAPLIRPGFRILELAAGTGYRAAYLSQMAGPSGAVVAVGSSRETIAYAQRRYPRPNIAFEVASPQALVGETDASFDMVILSSLIEASASAAPALTDLWRVLKPECRLIAHLRAPSWAGAHAAALKSKNAGLAPHAPIAEAKPPQELRDLEDLLQEVHSQTTPPRSDPHLDPPPHHFSHHHPQSSPQPQPLVGAAILLEVISITGSETLMISATKPMPPAPSG